MWKQLLELGLRTVDMSILEIYISSGIKRVEKCVCVFRTFASDMRDCVVRESLNFTLISQREKERERNFIFAKHARRYINTASCNLDDSIERR